jgi:hypothetical protein
VAAKRGHIRKLHIPGGEEVKPIILDLCAGTGAWSQPYVDAGYDVRRITLPEEDVRLYIPPAHVHGILAAPPCTHFASSGARWFKEKREGALLEGLAVVDACLRIIQVSAPVWWCLENPVGRLVHYLGKPKLYFDPWEYGDPYTKKTCLWGNFAIPVKNPCEPTVDFNEAHNDPRKRFPSKMHLLPPAANRSTLRSITPPSFARAFFEANP